MKRFAIALVAVMLSGCSWLQTHKDEIVDAAETACVLALTARQEIKTEAKLRGLTANEWAAVVCKVPDVLDAFLVEKDPKVAASEAVAVLAGKRMLRATP